MIEVTGNQISTDKIQIKQVFADDMWYLIPDYQRPYVWGADEITTLLDDISYASKHQPDNQYFLGSMVLHCEQKNHSGTHFQENIVLDGQQRLTTIYLIHAVIRDLTDDKTRRLSCRDAIFQKGNPDYDIPEKMRLEYAIRQEVQDFINKFVIKKKGTQRTKKIQKALSLSNDISTRNIANAILIINKWFSDSANPSIDILFPFLSMKVIMIYVASAELDDAFRLFTILNDRGIKLRNSDILKAQNLQKVDNEEKRIKYARFWEELEGDLEEDFDLFLSYIRTIVVKEKARVNLLKEFHENMYNPTLYDQKTKKRSPLPPLLKMGEETFELIKKYKSHLDEIIGDDNYKLNNNNGFDNLIKVLDDTAASDIWIPPLLCFREHFGQKRIYDFLLKLDNKFSGDWINRETPTTRIEAMNSIMKKIESLKSRKDLNTNMKIDTLLADEVFKINVDYFMGIVNDSKIYKKKFDRYLLRKIDFLLDAPLYTEKRNSYNSMSVEHILPQNPEDKSNWVSDFTDNEREDWTNALGNLVLISRRKNSSQGRLDFKDKKSKYFLSCIETFPNSLKVMNNTKWTIKELQKHHNDVIKLIDTHYRLNE